jgi:hypothetical protein
MVGFLAQQVLGIVGSQLEIKVIISRLECLPIYRDIDCKLIF